MQRRKSLKTQSKIVENKSPCSDMTNESEASTVSSKRSNPYVSDQPSPLNMKAIKKSPSSEDINSDDEEVESPRLRKIRIQKFYEPIYDNDKVYNYEEDPTEYKRARKRIQNRESASRVRHRKANNTEQLKGQLQGLRDEIMNLKQNNATLSTENVILRQQLFFYEKVLVSQRQAVAAHETFSLLNFPTE